MKIFSKRETLLQNMALMGIMAGVNITISVLTALLPFLGLFLVLILPLTSVIVEIYCKDRYYIIYAISTIGLSLAATLWNFDTTIFYLVPSIATGYLFGLACKKNIPSVWSILCCSIIQMGLIFASIPLINLITQVDMFEAFKTLFKIDDSQIAQIVFPLIICIGSFAQTVLSFIIMFSEVKKFGYNVEINSKHQLIYNSICFALCLSIFGIMFLSLTVTYILMIVCFYFAFYIIFDYIKTKSWALLISFGAGIIVTIIVFSILFNSMPVNSGFLLLTAFPLWTAIISLVKCTISVVKYKKRNN